MPLTSPFTRIAFAPADPPGGGDVPGGPRAQRPLVPGIPSRRVDPSGVVTQQTRHVRPHQQPPARHTIAEEGELVVGQGITVKGGIRNCRRLVVHGTVQATVPAQALEVGPDGVVEGRIDVGEATIAGRFDGDLVVDGALTVAPGGLIKGRVRYRTLTVESGGHVSAEIDHIEASPLPAAAAHAEDEAAAQAPADEGAAAPPETAAVPESETGGSEPAARDDASATSDAPAETEATHAAAAPGVPPAFSGLAGLNGGAGESLSPDVLRQDPRSQATTSAAAAADGTGASEDATDDAPKDVPEDALEDAEEDAERFYRSLARTSARV